MSECLFLAGASGVIGRRLVASGWRVVGPGTGFDAPWSPGPVHVDAAAKAAELAVARDVTGIYNIAEEDGAVSSERARRLLGWDAGWRADQ
jgi:hypothetical protein